MTGQSAVVVHTPSKVGLPPFLHALTAALMIALSVKVMEAYSVPEEATQNTPVVTVTDNSLPSSGNTETQDRETRLKDIEDELLKQLSLGRDSNAQESKDASLIDVKHIATNQVENQKAKAPQSPSTTSKALIADTAAQKIAAPQAGVSSGKEEHYNSPVMRSPQRFTVVPLASKASPHRTSTVKKTRTAEVLSATEMEHRLAIAETQITLLTKELENTKLKLTQSEAQVTELSQQTSNDSFAAQPRSYEVGDGTQRSVALANIDRRRPSPNTVSPDTVARVIKDKSSLRTGPGPRESTIFKLSRNEIVSIERRAGSWYRVATTDGTRGWISGGSLVFDEGRSANSTVHIGPYNPTLEPTGIRY